jgi:hypothetical protein
MKLVEILAMVAISGLTGWWVVKALQPKPAKDTARARRTAEQIRRMRSEARWEVDDTGTTDDGEVMVEIRLVAPFITEPYGRRVIGTFVPGDNLRWAELRGEADGIARDLNERIDQR